MKKQLHSTKLLNYLFCSIFLLLLGTNVSWGQNSELLNTSTPGVTTWTCPAGVTSVQVEAWGGGGGSGGVGNSTNLYVGGGGAGGNYVRKTSVTVVPGATYNVVVGAGGIGGLQNTGTVNGSGGGMSLLISPDLNSTPLIAALGGVGGGGGATTPKLGPGGVNASTNKQLTYTITNGGSGYTAAPTVTLSRPATLAASTAYAVGSQVFLGNAIWTCTVAGTTSITATLGTVASGTAVNGATFAYTGVAATATAVLTNGVVTAIIINQGSGYENIPVPTVTFTNNASDTTGSGAAVTLSAITNSGDFSFFGGNGGAGAQTNKTASNKSGAGGNSAGTASNGNNSTSGAASAVGASVTGNGLGGASVTGVSFTAACSTCTPAVVESAVGKAGIAGSIPGGGGGGPVGPSFDGSLGGAGKVVITLLDTTAPTAVTSASISNPLTASLQVNWVASQSSPDVTGYVVVAYPANTNPATASLVTGTTYVQGASFGTGTILYVGTDTSATNTGLIVNNTYYYKVFAYDANRNYSAEVETSGTTVDATDNTPPGNPGAATISNQTLTTMTTSWLPAASIDGGGYMVVRYSGDPSVETGADPVQKTTYAVNDIIATGTNPDGITAPKNGKVVYVGTDLSYESTGLTAADTSHFKIYTFDQDHNYSGSSFVSGKTATQIATPVALASSLPTATGFTANWIVAPVVGSYTINVYSAATSASTVVGWTIPAGVADATSLTADVTTANNTTKILTQNGGASIVTQAISSTTGLLGTISGNPGVAARGATYYSTAIVSGTEGVDAVYATPKAAPDRYWQVNANTVGYKNVTISSNQYSTDSGPRDWKLQYSSDGGSTFSDLGTTLTLSIATWDSSVSNIALPSVCENNPNVVLRWLQTSFTNTSGVEMTTPSTGGTSRIDNILVKGTKLTLEKSSNEGNNIATSKAITGIDAGSYYYDVVVTKDDVTGTTGIVSKYVSSANSNLVEAFTLTPLTAPVATATTNPTEFGFTANWGAVAGATDYLFYLYTAPTESNIAAWTFPSSGLILTADADKTNANNLTKEISNATGSYSDQGGLTTQATRGATYYGTTIPTQYWQVEVNTTGYENVNLSSVQYSTSTGPRDFKLEYKIGVNGTYADVPGGTIVVGSANWTSGVVSNLVLPAECNNQSSVFIRWTQTTFTDVAGNPMVTASGTNRIDDIYIKGAAYSLQANYPVTVSGTSTVLDGLTQGNYYYKVVANGDAVTSAKSVKSNAIGGIVYASSTEANFRSTASGNITSTGIWEYYNGAAWVTTASAPSGTNNNITISAGHTIALEGDFTVGTLKTLTVAGTINLAGHVVSGAGSFVLNSAATLKLGNNVSIAAAITTTTNTLSVGANYFFDGTSVAQHTGGLPGSTLSTSTANGSQNYTSSLIGNITVSNPLGVTMNQTIKLTTPGILTVKSTGKLLFGDGNTASETIASNTYNSGTFNLTGTGSFVAESDCTLVITSSKGISGSTDGNIRTSTARTFGSGINFVFAKNDGFNPISIGTSFYNGDINPATGIKNMTIDCPYGVYFASTYAGTGNNNASGFVTTLTYTGGNDITVNGALNFVSGKLYTGDYVTVATNSVPPVVVNTVSYYPVVSLVITPGNTSTLKLNVGPSGTITGAGTGWVVGNLNKATASGENPSFTYAIGNATDYTPLALTFSGNTSAAGSLTASTASGDHAAIATSGLISTKSVNRTWTLTNNALAGFGTYIAAFGFATTDSDAGTTPANYGVRLYNGSAWSYLTTFGTSTTAATAVGVSGFGDFAIAEYVGAPSAEPVDFCVASTVANLSDFGASAPKWYTAATGGTALESTTALVTSTYYVSQTVNGVESLRTPVAVTVNGIKVQPIAQPICPSIGASATLSVTSANPVATYQWEVQTKAATASAPAVWASVVNGGDYAGATTAALVITRTTKTSTPKSGTLYRVKVTDSCATIPSDAVAITDQALIAAPALSSTEAKLICKYIGTDNLVTFTATPAAGTNPASYSWTVPAGATISGVATGSSIQVNFHNVSAIAGAIGSVTVDSNNALGCLSGKAKVLALTTTVPKAPKSVALSSTAPVFNEGVLVTTSITAVKKAGNHVGTTNTLYLIVTDPSLTANHYDFTLPLGVNNVTGATPVGNSTTLYTTPYTGTLTVLTFNLEGVQAANTDLVFTATSVAGCDIAVPVPSSKSLSVKRAEAGTPKGLVLTDATDATAPGVLPVVLPIVLKKLDSYTGSLKTRNLTLTATPNTTAGLEASSYRWVLPASVSTTAEAYKVDNVVVPNTYISNSPSISVNLSNLTTAETAFPFKVFGVNGNGASLASKDLACTSAAPKAPAAIYAGATGSGTLFTLYNPSCNTVTISVPAVFGIENDFQIFSGGATIATHVAGSNVATIDLSGASAVAKSTVVIRAFAYTATGFISKDYTIKIGTSCSAPIIRIAPEALTAEAFKVEAYPNPSTEGFRVKSGNGKSFGVQVYDMLGRSIEQRQMSSDAQIGSNYAKGVYNVIVSQGANVKTLRVIKQ